MRDSGGEIEDLRTAEEKNAAAEHEEHAKRGDDRGDAGDGREEPIDQADGSADDERGGKRQPGATQRKRNVAVDEGADGEKRAGRDVDLAGEDDLVDGERHDRDDGDLLENAGEVGPRHEGRCEQRYGDGHREEKDERRHLRPARERAEAGETQAVRRHLLRGVGHATQHG